MANPDYKDLLLLARRDQKAMMVLAESDDPELVFNVGFHAQQAVEKALKSVISLRKLDYPHTHKLNVLHGLLIASDPNFPVALDDLNRLTPYAVESRYDIEALHLCPTPLALELVALVMAWADQTIQSTFSK